LLPAVLAFRVTTAASRNPHGLMAGVAAMISSLRSGVSVRSSALGFAESGYR